MISKPGIVQTVCKNGLFFIPRQNVAGFTVFKLGRGFTPRREARSLMTVSQSLPAIPLKTSSLCDRPLYYGRHGLCQQFLRTSSTQASPATSPAEGEKPKGEGEKPKGNVNKTQVLFDEVVNLVAGGKVTLVDVREPDELQQTGSLPGCINIPLTKLKAALAMNDEEFTAAYNSSKLQKDDANIIFYGLSSVKSSAAVEIAHKAGFKKSRHYPGGLEEWSQKYQKT